MDPSLASLRQIPFGQSARKLYPLEPGYTNLNNGSFGTVPLYVEAARREWLDRSEKNPDKWLRHDYFQQYERVRDEVADYVGAEKENLVFVQNATNGVNSVVRSLNFKPEEKVVYFSTTYNAVKQLLFYLRDSQRLSLVEVQVDFPFKDEDLLKQVGELLDREPNIKLAIVDAISSVPALLFPFVELNKLFKSRGITVLVDGAHAYGQIPLKLEECGADFFVTNIHKWGQSSRPCALLYATKKQQMNIHPSSISHGYETRSFYEDFQWTGTTDLSQIMSVSAALAYRKAIGEERILRYIHELAVKGGQKVATILGTEVIGDEHQIPAMVNVRLPLSAQHGDKHIRQLAVTLLQKFNV
ncbi:PLP-dependent transferase, partial [Basidiobolus meristosporus CBS 931.73]